MPEDTAPQSPDSPNPPEGITRGRSSAMWVLLFAALLIHAVVILAASPTFLFGEEATTPEARLRKAKELVERQEYAEAVELLEGIVKEMPKAPPVFRQAEEILPQVRLKDLQKQERLRKEREAAEKEDEDGDGEETGDGDGDGDGEDEGPDSGGKGEDLPDIELPTLPDIE